VNLSKQVWRPMRTAWWAQLWQDKGGRAWVLGSFAVALILFTQGLTKVQAAQTYVAQASARGLVEGRPVLTQGDTGSAVEQLQADLAEAGVYRGAIDGIYGPGTAQAVSAFQRQQNLPVDGVVGAQTWQALRDQPLSIIWGTSPGLDVEVLSSMFTPLTFSQPPPPPSPFWLVLMPLVPLIGGGLTYFCHRLQAQHKVARSRARARKRRHPRKRHY
jgi:hypothetical protein